MAAGLGTFWRSVARHSPNAPRNDNGFTLVETLITVWILGAVMTAFCGALFTMVKSSDQVRRKTLVEAELRRYADAVRAAPYQGCADMPVYIANGWTDDYSAAQTSMPGTVDTPPDVKYWDPSSAVDNPSFADSPPAHSPAFCDVTGNGGDSCEQRIHLVVQTTGDQPLSLATDIFKRSLATDIKGSLGCP